MLTIKRAAVIVITFLIMFAMTYVPPWRMYDTSTLNAQNGYTKIREIGAYAWHDQPPTGNLPSYYYTINYDVLWIQIFFVGLAGAASSYGKRGVIVYFLPVFFGFLGCLAANRMIPQQEPHHGWVSPIWILIGGVIALIGFCVGLTLALGIVSAMNDLPKPRRRNG